MTKHTDYQSNLLNQYTDIIRDTDSITPFFPEYDTDGNQTCLQSTNGRWIVTYDANDRPVRFVNEDALIVVTCQYDYLGRRYEKKVTVNGNYTCHERYLYRGYLQISEINLLTNPCSLKKTYLWDPTQSTATRPLMAVAWSSDGTRDSVYYFAHDLMKNVTALVDIEGACVAQYAYAQFGTLLAADGSQAEVNKFRFSSEYMDDELGLIYYNYRHANPLDGRWINRDPIAKQSSNNLYGFVENKSFMIDNLGLSLGFANHYCTDASFAFGNVLQEMEFNFYDCPEGAKVRWNSVTHLQSTVKGRPEYRTKTHTQGETPKANRCGSEGGTPVPNSFPEFDFTAACNAHDICYGTCGSDKAKCDSQFLEDMNSECKKVKLSPGAPNLRDVCYSFAKIYESFVVYMGGEPYDCAQDNACEWKPCPCKKQNK